MFVDSNNNNSQFAPLSSNASGEEINSFDCISQIAEEIIFNVFGYLSAVELAKCSEVSRRWARLSSDPDLWKEHTLELESHNQSSLSSFDASDWKKYVDLTAFNLEVDDLNVDNANDDLSFKARFVRLKKILALPIEMQSGVLHLTMPKGLNLNKLVALAAKPKTGPATNFARIDQSVLGMYGDAEVDKTYRVVITKNIFAGSSQLMIGAQREILANHRCNMPKMLETATLLVVTHLKNGERAYQSLQFSSLAGCVAFYTRCSETINPDSHVAVGGFLNDGISISFGGKLPNPYQGVGGTLP